MNDLAKAVPWEYARIDGFAEPIGLDTRTTVVRRHGGVGAPGGTNRVVLVVSPHPCANHVGECRGRTEGSPHWDHLGHPDDEVLRVIDKITRLYGRPPEVVEGGRSDVEAACRSGLDLFVFLGHGFFPTGREKRIPGAEVDEPSLVLTGDDGPEYLPASLLAESVGSAQLVALGCCYGGSEGRPGGADDDWYQGFRSRLEEAGVPGVLGMNGRVEDGHALEFLRVVFEFLANGWMLDEAVANGREKLLKRGPLPRWGHPILSLGPKDPKLPGVNGGRMDLEPEDLALAQALGMRRMAVQRQHRAPVPEIEAIAEGVPRMLAYTLLGFAVSEVGSPLVPEVPVALAADGRVAAAIKDSRIVWRMLNRYRPEKPYLDRVHREDLGYHPMARVLAVSVLGQDEVSAVVIDEVTELVHIGPSGVRSRTALAQSAVTAAAFVRGRAWWVEDGRLCAETPLDWPVTGIVDLDIAGPIGGEVAALVTVDHGGAARCVVIGDLFGERREIKVVEEDVTAGTTVTIQRLAPGRANKVVVRLSGHADPLVLDRRIDEATEAEVGV